MTTSEAEPPRLNGFEFRRWLGSGGFADVFLYERRWPRGPVAIKVLRRADLSSGAVEHFTAEADAMGILASHPYIVPILLADVAPDGRPYLVMQYYPRDSLAVRIRREPLDVPETLRIGVKIASAVETAHRAGILHRDIKPANILVSDFGEPCLTDFGISLVKSAGSSSQVDAISLPWASPETLEGSGDTDERADVYSLGATLFTLLAGHTPFGSGDGKVSLQELAHRIATQPPQTTGRPDVPPHLERLLGQTMAKSPDRRPHSALDLARSLQDVEASLSLSVTQLVIPDQPSEDTWREPTTPTGGTTVDRGASSAPHASETKFRPQHIDPEDPRRTERRQGVPPDEPATKVRVRGIDPDSTDMPAVPVSHLGGRRASNPESGLSEVGGSGRAGDDQALAGSGAVSSHRSRWIVGGAVAVTVIVITVATLLAASAPKALSHGHSGGYQAVRAPAPTDLQCVRLNPSHVRLTWQAGAPGASFSILRAAAPSGPKWTGTATAARILLRPRPAKFVVVQQIAGETTESNTASCPA